MILPFTYTIENNLTFLHPGEAGDVNTRIVEGVYLTTDDMSSGNILVYKQHGTGLFRYSSPSKSSNYNSRKNSPRFCSNEMKHMYPSVQRNVK